MERMILKITISGVKTLCATAKVLLRENMEGNFINTGTTQKYLYNGKELYANGLGWYDYGARYYDPVIGRFHGVDPLADASPGWSPYRFGFNAPINFRDPSGMIEQHFTGAAARSVFSQFQQRYNASIGANTPQKRSSLFDEMSAGITGKFSGNRVTLKSNGEVSSLSNSSGLNKFYDYDSGEELILHDPNGADNGMLYKNFCSHCTANLQCFFINII